jgi:prevent-host-death family protein
MDVGIRDFKQHLSEYLERAARGESIYITDRGKRKVMLSPLPGHVGLARGIVEKWIRAGSESPPAPVTRQRATRLICDVLEEDRDA